MSLTENEDEVVHILEKEGCHLSRCDIVHFPDFYCQPHNHWIDIKYKTRHAVREQKEMFESMSAAGEVVYIFKFASKGKNTVNKLHQIGVPGCLKNHQDIRFLQAAMFAAKRYIIAGDIPLPRIEPLERKS